MGPGDLVVIYAEDSPWDRKVGLVTGRNRGGDVIALVRGRTSVAELAFTIEELAVWA